jgi:hypothetical protein
LNARTNSICPLDFELDLAFELCHLALFGVSGSLPLICR